MATEKYMIINQKLQKYWDDDYGKWVDFLHGSIYEKINGKYYSTSGEQSLPMGGEWVTADFY